MLLLRTKTEKERGEEWGEEESISHLAFSVVDLKPPSSVDEHAKLRQRLEGRTRTEAWRARSSNDLVNSFSFCVLPFSSSLFSSDFCAVVSRS